MSKIFDYAVVGAGIAGASVAFELASQGSVLILERETQPGFHASGRSAAIYSELYGNAIMRGLTTASRSFFEEPPTGLFDRPLLSSRGALYVARSDQTESLERFHEQLASKELVERRDGTFAHLRSGLLAQDYAAACLWEPGAREIDVHALLSGYLKGARRRGAVIQVQTAADELSRRGGAWQIRAGQQVFRAQVVVNAAGAWAESVGGMAGAAPLRLLPRRRSVCMIQSPDGVLRPDGALVIDIDEQFYFKPDAGQVLLSPADETPSTPCDAYADDIDIAMAVDRFERASGTVVRHVGRRWAGLRTFSDDRTIVIGFDTNCDDFFWLAGQGGYGMQTAPAVATSAAALLVGEDLPAEVRRYGVDVQSIEPDRFGRTGAPGVEAALERPT